jgi:hypothetical protein
MHTALVLTRSRLRRPTLVALAVTMLLAALGSSASMASAAPAPGTLLFSRTDVELSECTGRINTGYTVSPGQRVEIVANPNRQIWSGVWFSGDNGPAGWTTNGNSQTPAPQFRAFSLLARVGTDYKYIGNGASFTATTSGPLYLVINDDVYCNGAHSFMIDSVRVTA